MAAGYAVGHRQPRSSSPLVASHRGQLPSTLVGDVHAAGFIVASFALAFAQIIVEGQIDPEVRRRAVFALKRQSLPALLHAWGERRILRAERVERMVNVLVSPLK